MSKATVASWGDDEEATVRTLTTYREVLTLVEHDGRISGYATLIAFFGHAVGETNEDLKALIGSASEFLGPGFFLPTRNADLFRWCLAHGLHVAFQSVLMSFGLYSEPKGAFLPSVQ